MTNEDGLVSFVNPVPILNVSSRSRFEPCRSCVNMVVGLGVINKLWNEHVETRVFSFSNIFMGAIKWYDDNLKGAANSAPHGA